MQLKVLPHILILYNQVPVSCRFIPYSMHILSSFKQILFICLLTNNIYFIDTVNVKGKNLSKEQTSKLVFFPHPQASWVTNSPPSKLLLLSSDYFPDFLPKLCRIRNAPTTVGQLERLLESTTASHLLARWETSFYSVAFLPPKHGRQFNHFLPLTQGKSL